MMEVYCVKDNQTYDVSSMVQDAEIKGSKYKTARSLTLKVLNTSKGLHGSFKFEEGNTVVFRWKQQELLRGVLWKVGKDKSETDSLTIYDLMIYLLKNTETYVFTSKKASDIAKIICSDFGIPIGNIADTGYVIPSLVCDGKTLYDIIMQALEITRKQTGVNYYLYSDKGLLFLVRRVEQIRRWVIEDGVNLIDYNYESSLEDTFTRVKLVAGEKDKTIIATAENGELQKKFGLLQYYEKVSDNLNQSQLTERANQIIKQKGRVDRQFSISALGLPDVISGTAIYVIESNLNIKKGYFVEEDSHNFKGKEHTMNLKLSETDKLPEVSV
ncbi:hypothetical protein [Clostridium sp. HMP27]|uniref:XkdQ/YqbQ family protein n=1 Tax=Clostridium sp. HMP27 TaxID=1487921 RepID=UPI00052D612D|nr:hypothetical protein [Clostridium sp. HMP27]KGK88044.1 hypothetical protein DP68_08945 [Clostridium sp. HMP27]